MKKELGQFFTTNEILLDSIHKFVKNTTGQILEPSCGAGHIVDYLIKHGESRPFECIELDTTVELLEPLKFRSQVSVHHGDFLQYQFGNDQFMTIVGNPPYVKRPQKCNIYIEFIDKCIDLLSSNGELILVIPSDFFKLTSSSHVKAKMQEHGTITHIFHPHNERLFQNAAQDVIVFRFEKGLHTPSILYNDEQRITRFQSGSIFFTANNLEEIPLSDIFDIKVGMVSGADKVFRHETLGNIIFKSFNGDVRYILVNELPAPGQVRDHLESYKEHLLSRRIKKFNESNWFQWGCIRNSNFVEQNKGKDCIYCATITRKNQVFVKGNVTNFDGSLLCLLPKQPIDFDKTLTYLNSNSFLDNFSFAGRYKLGQKCLSDCLVPKTLVQAGLSNHQNKF